MQPRLQSRRAGFTLIEMLAVLLILSVLSYFLVVNLSGASETTKVGIAKTGMSQIGTMLDQLDDDGGDYPASQLTGELGTSANTINVGAECLYLALCADGAPGNGKLDRPEDLCNTDGDALSKRPKGFERQDLYEMADPWGNPIAYIRASDYEREFIYRCIDPTTGEEGDYPLRAQKNPATGRFQEPHRFQLFSAGPDGAFGTEDDLSNFQTKK